MQKEEKAGVAGDKLLKLVWRGLVLGPGVEAGFEEAQPVAAAVGLSPKGVLEG